MKTFYMVAFWLLVGAVLIQDRLEASPAPPAPPPEQIPGPVSFCGPPRVLVDWDEGCVSIILRDGSRWYTCEAGKPDSLPREGTKF